ncbi:MAG: SDR family NAD(P)-dependent oxidoreductase [Acidobacteriaceae bacterium]
MPEHLEGQRVLVAGGTGGLGRAVSLAFLNQGAQVAVTYRADPEFVALKNAAGPAAPLLQGHQVDATDEAAVTHLVETLTSDNGRIDALVNTIGGYAAGPPLWQTDPATLDRMLTLNLRAGYLLTRAVVPAMLKQHSGAIVNIAARAALDHAAGAFAYAASKAAAVAMIDSLAADLKGTGVRANSVLPSIIDTEPNRRAMPQADFTKWPKPEEIARVILFLCSEEARLIHGASIPVYGSN